MTTAPHVRCKAWFADSLWAIGKIIRSAKKQGSDPVQDKLTKAGNNRRSKSSQHFEVGSDGPKLKRSVVVFLDILGTKDEASGAGAQAHLRNLYDALNSASIREVVDEKIVYRAVTFTDNIAIGVPIHKDGEAELGGAFLTAATYQLELALRGIFVRGGIVVGDVFMADDFVFGGGLNEAYDLESKHASFPRVILSGEAAELALRHTKFYGAPEDSPQFMWLLTDQDGSTFLNYLAWTLEHSEAKGIEMLKAHRDRVQAKLSQFQPDKTVGPKYLWVAAHHNWFCNQYHPGQPDLNVACTGSSKFSRIL
jgi:hypothetical protein